MRHKALATRCVQVLAVVVSALAVVPSIAHLATLPHKIGLSQSAYFAVQSIYTGWAALAALWPAAAILNGLSAWRVRAQHRPFRLALLAALCYPPALAIFIIWTLPADQATADWTSVRADWEDLRLRWEYSHAVNAVLLFIALCFSTLSAMAWKRPAPD